MPTDFLHGVEVISVDDGSRPVQTVRSAVIGVVGTAPDADPIKFPLNEPVLVTSRLQGDSLKAQIGPKKGTLYHAIQQIYDQASAVTVVVRVAEGTGASDAEKLANTVANIIGGTVNGEYTGIQALLGARSKLAVTPKILIAPQFTSWRPSGGVTNIALNTPGTGYTSPPTVTITGGGGAGATAVAFINDQGVVTNVNVTNPGGSYETVPTIAFTGGGATTQATGTATIGDYANPVASALQGVADKLRAVCPIGGPNTTDVAAHNYREDLGSKRIYLIDPGVKGFLGNVVDREVFDYDASAVVAGLIAKTDATEGFWQSPSNRVLQGIIGTGRSVDFTLGDTTSRANLLNENQIATIIREDGFRLWGNRTTANDPKWQFLSVVRTADMVDESIMRAHLWAVDRCIGRALLDAVVESVNDYLRVLRARGAILGGQCWWDPELNPPSVVSGGQLFFDYDFTAPPPAERITFRSHLVNDYISNITPQATVIRGRVPVG